MASRALQSAVEQRALAQAARDVLRERIAVQEECRLLERQFFGGAAPATDSWAFCHQRQALRMKWLLLLTVLSLSAAAQPVDPCTRLPSTAPVWVPPDLSKPIVCERETGRTVRFNTKGALAWRYCWSPLTNKYFSQVIASPWADFQNVPSMALDIVQAGIGANNETIRTLMVKYTRGSFVDVEHAAVWCPFRDEIKAGLPIVPVSEWVPAGPTLYNFTGTALAGVAGTAKPGQTCDCTKPFKLGTFTYCPLTGGPTTAVARCKKL